MSNEGLLICGIVQGRVKKLVGENKTELITYKIAANGKEYYVKDWSPNGSYFNMGEKIEAPISVKIYSKNGQVSLDYAILRKNTMFGEEF